MTTGKINYSPDYKSEEPVASNFIQVGPGGLCFAHGPYAEGSQCPQWPRCATDLHDPKWVAEGARRINEPRERARLEREVVELVKRWSLGAVSDGALRTKVMDLLEFEAKQK